MFRLSSAVRKERGMVVSTVNAFHLSFFVRTLSELAAVELPCLELDGDDMSEGLVEEFYGYTEA